MAGKPQVTLTFAGDSAKLESAFDKVGASAKKMEGDVGSASRSVGDSAGGFDRAGEAADGAEGKAQGFSDTLTGTKDVMGGVGEIAKGNLFEGFVQVGQGAADLAGGLATFVIPAIKNMSLSMIGNATNAIRSTASLVANKVAMFASAVATNAMTVAQKALNLAMRMNPIGLIITGLLLLTAGVIWAYKNVGWFRAGVDTAMRGIKAAFGWVVTAGGQVWEWFRTIAPKIGGALKGVGAFITAPFRAAFDAVRAAWNNTVGGKGFTVPDWIPGVGGKSFRIPTFHTGGIMPGAPGSEGLALLQAGERITPRHQVDREQQAVGDTIVYITIDGEQLQGRITKTVRDTNRELKRTVQAA
jgi:hypothetical protein